MTTEVDICNRALLKIGSQRIISSLTQDSVEAAACNTIYANSRDDLLRMAPWDCALKTANLVYITSVPGTMENVSAATPLWEPGQPRPPWAYEYQYPADCLRACWIIPSAQTGFSGVPITTAITGSTPTTWLQAPIVFKVGIDNFIMVSGATPATAGTGNAVGDVLTLANVLNSASQPQGAPAQLTVLTINGSGGVLTASVIPQILDSSPALGGSYFYGYASPAPVASTTGTGTGATFNLTPVLNKDQRVILTNQEFSTLCYVRQVTDPNVWDPLFQEAFTNKLAADLCMILVGDKNLANASLARTNTSIGEARKADGNEGLTINDVVPDWIRIRGIDFDTQYLGPYGGFDWGGQLPLFA